MSKHPNLNQAQEKNIYRDSNYKPMSSPRSNRQQPLLFQTD